MNNPLFKMMASGNGPINQAQQLLQRFNQFRSNFRGDPQQQVQQLLNSGRVTQQQYDQAVRMAQQFQRMMGGK